MLFGGAPSVANQISLFTTNQPHKATGFRRGGNAQLSCFGYPTTQYTTLHCHFDSQKLMA